MINETIQNRIAVQIKKVSYIYERYGTLSTFALLYHEKPLPVVELSHYLRTSDHLITVDKKHHFVTFSHTISSDAYKASQNLLLHLDSSFNSETTAIALDTFDPSNSPQIVISRLQQILQEARHSPFSRIEDEGALDERI